MRFLHVAIITEKRKEAKLYTTVSREIRMYWKGGYNFAPGRTISRFNLVNHSRYSYKFYLNDFSGRICSVHFRPDAFKRNLKAELLGLDEKLKLKHDAVPTEYKPDCYRTKSKTLAVKARVNSMDITQVWVREGKWVLLGILFAEIERKVCFF